MIPSARFGDIIVNQGYNDYISCNLYSLYEGGIENVAENKEFCLFILTAVYRKMALHDHAIMSFDGSLTREQAEALFNDLDETSHMFFKECATLLNIAGLDDVTIRENEDKFRRIASKVIEDFDISEPETMDTTFKEYAQLEFKVANLKLIEHITDGLVVEC